MGKTKMALRNIIKIDEEKCNGCGECVPACAEGAIEIVNGKAKLIKEIYCDGLGACLGHCPQDAITIEKRQVPEFDEQATKAHLVEQKKSNPANEFVCPGSKAFDFRDKDEQQQEGDVVKVKSQLKQWPIQLHLISPEAPYYQGADVLLVADCVAYALGSFHTDYLKGKSIAIACPKLDEGQDVYAEKIKSWLEDAKINTLTVLIMQVPCCMGLLNLTKRAVESSERKVPIKSIVVGLQGEIISEDWV